MKNINKSNAMELVGKEIVNVKNNVIGVVVRELDGKYTVDVNGEEKTYSLSTVIRNWKINEDEAEETSNEEIITEEVNDEDEITEETEEVINEENIEDENKVNEVVEEETEEVINENNEDEITEETEEVINESDEVEEFILKTENRGIIDNIKETEGKVKITGHLYGIPVKFDKINQTTVWKT